MEAKRGTDRPQTEEYFHIELPPQHLRSKYPHANESASLSKCMQT